MLFFLGFWGPGDRKCYFSLVTLIMKEMIEILTNSLGLLIMKFPTWSWNFRPLQTNSKTRGGTPPFRSGDEDAVILRTNLKINTYTSNNFENNLINNLENNF